MHFVYQSYSNTQIQSQGKWQPAPALQYVFKQKPKSSHLFHHEDQCYRQSNHSRTSPIQEEIISQSQLFQSTGKRIQTQHQMNRTGSGRLPLQGRATRRAPRPTSPAGRKPQPSPRRRRPRQAPAGAPSRTARWEGRGEQFPPCQKCSAAPIPADRIAWGKFGRIGNRDLLPKIGILFREEGGEDDGRGPSRGGEGDGRNKLKFRVRLVGARALLHKYR